MVPTTSVGRENQRTLHDGSGVELDHKERFHAMQIGGPICVGIAVGGFKGGLYE